MVAIKIHQLNQDWTEQKKADYQRHARREAEIQKSINHVKIVRLYDRFEVDINTYVKLQKIKISQKKIEKIQKSAKLEKLRYPWG